MLDGKDREELHTIAGAVGVKAATRMRKADLIDAILEAANGGNDDSQRRPQLAMATEPTSAKTRRVRSARASQVADDDPSPRSAAEENALGSDAAVDDRSPRSPRPRTRRSTAATAPAPEPTPSDHAGCRAARDDVARRRRRRSCRPRGGRRRRRRRTRRHERRRRSGGRAPVVRRGQPPRPPSPPRSRRGQDEPRRSPAGNEFQGDPIEVQGLLDLRDEGYGFLRDDRLPARLAATSTSRRRRCGASRCARATSSRARRGRRRATRSTRRCCASTRSTA